MPTFVEMDERVPLSAQMEEKLGPVGPRDLGMSAQFNRAFSYPEFRSHLGHYPASTRVSPHLFQKLAMPGICVSQPGDS
jgi:hypothetical protein